MDKICQVKYSHFNLLLFSRRDGQGEFYLAFSVRNKIKDKDYLISCIIFNPMLNEKKEVSAMS